MVSTFEFSGNTVGLLIKSDLDKAIFNEMEDLIRKKFRDFKKINLFVEIERDHHISLKALMKHFYFHFEHAKRFQKIAVVTDKEWLKKMVMIKGLMMNAEVKTFPHKNRKGAIRWIAE